MVLKLFAHPLSSNALRVAITLKEYNVPFELVMVDLLKREQKTATYMEHQPFGVVPYIQEDDGFELYESRAIARYIAKKYANQGPNLLPLGDDKAYALFERGVSMEQGYFEVPIQKINFETVVKKLRSMPADENLVAENRTLLESRLDVYEIILSKQEYIGGNEVTLADLLHLPHAYTLVTRSGHGDIITTRPNVKKWYEEISARPSWQALKDGIKSSP